MAGTVHDVTMDVQNLVNQQPSRATAGGPPTLERAVKAVNLVPLIKSAEQWASEEMTKRNITVTRLRVEVPNVAAASTSFSLPTGFVHVYQMWEREANSDTDWLSMRYTAIPVNYTPAANRGVYDFQAGVTEQVTIPAGTEISEFLVDGAKIMTVTADAMPTTSVDLIPFAYDAIVYYTAHLALLRPPSDLGLSREFKQTAIERLNSLITINTQMQQQRPMRPAPSFNSGYRLGYGAYLNRGVW